MPSAINLIRAASLSDVAQYAYAATAPAESRLIFLAGACPLNEDGSTAAIGNYAGQQKHTPPQARVRQRADQRVRPLAPAPAGRRIGQLQPVPLGFHAGG